MARSQQIASQPLWPGDCLSRGSWAGADRNMKLPAVREPYVYGALLSCVMCVITTGIATFLALGVTIDAPAAWFTSWLAAWAVAFPTVLVVGPFVRRVTAQVVTQPRPQ